MRALLDNHFPIVYLEENGLTPYTKPGGEFCEARARGKLLILAPWEHHNEKTLIMRDKCLALNNMAKELYEITHKLTWGISFFFQNYLCYQKKFCNFADVLILMLFFTAQTV